MNEYFGVVGRFAPQESDLEWHQKKDFKRTCKCQALSLRQWKTAGGFQVATNIMKFVFKPIIPVSVTIESEKYKNIFNHIFWPVP